ncbi:MAG TPA: SCP2 sterol-binding domain-containing protein [Steroidobacteraceae bacterium]
MFAAPLTGMLDRGLAASPRARALCLALEGRRLKIGATGLPVQLLLTASAGSLQCASVQAGDEQPAADVTVSGSPLALLALAGGDSDAALASAGLSSSGDEALAQQFLELARLLRPNFESLLGGALGRMNAHLAVRAFAQVKDWGRAAGASLLRNSAEYLAHESRDLVSRAEAEGFLGGVEALRAQLQRAEARAATLHAQLERLGTQRARP